MNLTSPVIELIILEKLVLLAENMSSLVFTVCSISLSS